MIEVTAAIGRAGSPPQRSSQWRRASATGSMRSGAMWAYGRSVPGPTTIAGGLVDAHAHLTLDLDGAGSASAEGPARVAVNAAATHGAGVLAIRDAGSREGIAGAGSGSLRRVIAAGPFLAPEG